MAHRSRAPITMASLLSGQDSPTRTALPAGEFLQPITIAALVILIANDWWLKPSSWAPAELTGKLSDFAGLLFFPLLMTSLVDCALLGLFRLGLAVDFSLRRWKLAVSIVGTGTVFCALKLWPWFTDQVLALAARLGLSAQIVLDPLDLLALPMLALAWWLGRREISQMPLGRLEFLLRAPPPQGAVGAHLHDLLACGANPAKVSRLSEAIEVHRAHPSELSTCELEAALASLRDLSPVRA